MKKFTMYLAKKELYNRSSSRNKIHSIKQLRAIGGMPLSEAKYMVEMLESGQRFVVTEMDPKFRNDTGIEYDFDKCVEELTDMGWAIVQDVSSTPMKDFLKGAINLALDNDDFETAMELLVIAKKNITYK